MKEDALIVFGRLPIMELPAKTRLGKEISDSESATELGHFLTRKTLHGFSDFPATRFFCYGTSSEIQDVQIHHLQDEFDHWKFFPQKIGKDVRAMKEAFDYVFTKGFKRALLIGTDIIGLHPDRGLELFEALRHFDVCIQPMQDKGYGAIGMSQNEDIFSEIKNFKSHSTGYDLIHETEALCTQKKLSLFVHPERLFDIDTKEDLQRLLKEEKFWTEDKKLFQKIVDKI